MHQFAFINQIPLFTYLIIKKNIRWELVPALWMEDDLAKWYLTPLGPKDRFIELNLMSCLDVVWLDLYNPNFHTPFIVYLAGLASISLHKLNRCILHLSWLVAIYFSQYIIKISKIHRQGRGTKGGGEPHRIQDL